MIDRFGRAALMKSGSVDCRLSLILQAFVEVLRAYVDINFVT